MIVKESTKKSVKSVDEKKFGALLGNGKYVIANYERALSAGTCNKTLRGH